MKNARTLIKILLAASVAAMLILLAACGKDRETEGDEFDETFGGSEAETEETAAPDSETETEEQIDVTFPKDEF